MYCLKDFNFFNKTTLIRTDYNVPLDKNLNIVDDKRIKESLPTLKTILKQGGKIVIISHLGRPEGMNHHSLSLKPIQRRLASLLSTNVFFAENLSQAEKRVKELLPKEILLIENIRFWSEEKKADRSFALRLSKLADIFVHEAFGCAHRKDASTYHIMDFFEKNKCMGLLLEKEIKNAMRFIQAKEHPVTAILGGAKISDKLLLIESLLDKVDHLLIGGGMSYNFFKSMGYQIGTSICQDSALPAVEKIKEKVKKEKKSFHLPIDVIVTQEFSESGVNKTVLSHAIPPGWMALDIGPATVEHYRNIILQSKNIIWNGPVGVFELEPYNQGSMGIAKAMGDAKIKGSFTMVGGGDTAAAISGFELEHSVNFISTGGGSLLTFLQTGTLPILQKFK